MKSVHFKNFRGGWCVDDLPLMSSAQPREEMMLNQLSLAENVIIQPDGKLKTRCGMKHLANVPDQNPYGAVVFNATDIYVVDILGNLLRYRTTGVGAGWATILATTDYTRGLVLGAKIYYCKGTGIVEFDPSTATGTPIASSPIAPWILLAHGDRLWTVNANTPMTLEGSTVGDPTNFTDGFSVVIPEENSNITGLGSLDGDLYIFTAKSIWILSGYSDSDFSLNKLGPNSHNVSFAASICEVSLVGFGKALAFCDDSGCVRAVNRSGIIEVCRAVGPVALHGFAHPAFLPDSGLLLISNTSDFVAIHCNLPFTDSGGMTQWPVTKFTWSPGSIVTTSFIIGANLKLSSNSETGGRKFALIFAIASPSAIQRPIFSFAQVDQTDTVYFVADDYYPGQGIFSPDRPYYQVQGKIRLPPFSAGSDSPKTWGGLTLQTNVPGAHMTNFSMVEYMDKTLDYPNAITAPAGKYAWFDVRGFTEWIQLEMNLFGSSEGRANAWNHVMEIHDLLLEYEP